MGRDKFGVKPEQVIDVQSLAGDSSDNVPGVPGIGIKTAAELINKYKTLENLLNKASEIPQNKRRETLLNNKDRAMISKKLVTLKNDVPLKNDAADFIIKNVINKKIIIDGTSQNETFLMFSFIRVIKFLSYTISSTYLFIFIISEILSILIVSTYLLFKFANDVSSLSYLIFWPFFSLIT